MGYGLKVISYCGIIPGFQTSPKNEGFFGLLLLFGFFFFFFLRGWGGRGGSLGINPGPCTY